MFTALVGAHLALIWTVRVFPFIDLPDHLATSTIIRYIGEPTNRFSEFFSVGSFLFRPNVFHLLFCSSDVFPTVEVANRFYYSLYVILLPLSVLLLIRKLGGDVWYGLLSFLLLYNLSVSWGFAGYTLSIPVCFIIFLLTIDHLHKPGLLVGAALTALFVLLFLVHALATVFAVGGFVLCCLLFHRKSPKGLAGSLIVLIPVAVLIVIWWQTREVSTEAGPGFFSSLCAYYRQKYFSSLTGRLRLVVFDNYFLFSGVNGCVVAAFLSLLLAVPWISSATRPALLASQVLAWARTRPAPILVLMVWSLVCFLALPGEIFNFQILYPRFAVTFLLAAVILSGVAAPLKNDRLKILWICIACLLHLTLWSDYFRDFESRNVSFNRSFFPEDSNRKTLGALVYDIKFRGKPVYFHFPSYYTVWTQGVATFRIVDLIDFAPPVRRKKGGAYLPFFKEWAWASRSFDPNYMAVDYVLVRGSAPLGHGAIPPPFNPIGSAGKWKLYGRSSHGGGESVTR